MKNNNNNNFCRLLDCIFYVMFTGVLFGLFLSLIWMAYMLISHGMSSLNDIIRKLVYTGNIGTAFGMIFGFLFYIFCNFKKPKD